MHLVSVGTDLMAHNNEIAEENRTLFREKNLTVLNLMSAPGAGKTSFLEATLPILKAKLRIGIIEGDMQGSADADRLADLDLKVHQINTHSLCHLDAAMIHNALSNFDLDNLDLLIIENVGNLVCPADFDLGENAKIMIASVAEGDDKPAKYPVMFRNAGTIILNKIDLLEGNGDSSNFNRERFYKGLRDLNPESRVFEISAIRKNGIEDIAGYIAALARK